MRLGIGEPDSKDGPPMTGQPSAELVLTREQQSCRVIGDGGTPFEFWAMAALIDAVVHEVEWDEGLDAPGAWPSAAARPLDSS